MIFLFTLANINDAGDSSKKRRIKIFTKKYVFLIYMCLQINLYCSFFKRVIIQ